MSNSKETSPRSVEAESLDALAQDAALGNEESFSRLVRHFTPALMGMIAPLSVPPAEKEDLMQEGLIGLYKAVRLFDPALSSFATFARLCMRSSVIDGARKYRSTAEEDVSEDAADACADPALSPEGVLMQKLRWQEWKQRVDRALSPMERRVFGLSLQGRTAAEIASLLGKDKKSVENTLYRARRKLSSPS
ncbi:MAG: sigma-70 family RNA polymerase sigma factor [Clostridia bacterium]|nr:sigma-70 family RNA polymerase sigma factor [Clostridia bacterium]